MFIFLWLELFGFEAAVPLWLGCAGSWVLSLLREISFSGLHITFLSVFGGLLHITPIPLAVFINPSFSEPILQCPGTLVFPALPLIVTTPFSILLALLTRTSWTSLMSSPSFNFLREYS